MSNLTTITRRPLRRLLQLDQPVQLLTPDEAEVERDRHLRWNFLVNSFDVIFFMGGLSLISSTTILPLFISKLTSSTLPLALMAMLAQGGFMLPQLLTANIIERLDRKKPIVVNIGFLTERLPAILFILAPLAAYRSPTLAVVLLLLLYGWFTFGGGMVAAAWQDMIARCFPVTQRGRFFGGTMFIGTLLGVGAASIAGQVLDRVAFPLNFIYLFAVAGMAITLSWTFLALTREPVVKASVPRRTTRQYLVELPKVVQTDHNFRSFLLARFVLALAEMGSGFLTVAAIQMWAISDGMVATFTTASLVGQTAGSLLMGFLADRRGHRLSLELAALTAVFAFALAWLAPDPNWFIGTFFLLGFFSGARIVSGMLVVVEFCAPEKRPTYIGLTNTLAGIGSMAAPLLGALLVKISYTWVFAASVVVSLLAFLMLRFWVKEPREV